MANENDVLLGNIELTADIVSSFARHNSLSPSEFIALITDIHAVLRQLSSPLIPAGIERPAPAVSIRKSITPDYLICLEDGKPFKSLKRHLRSKYNLTPDEYRVRWNLPDDYPMVSPNYASERSQLAKARGLGKSRRTLAAE